MPFSYCLYKLLKPWFKAKPRLMIQRFLWEALIEQLLKKPHRAGHGGVCRGGACVTGLAFNHILSISAPRKSPHSHPASGEAGWTMHCTGAMLSNRGTGDLRTRKLPIKHGRKATNVKPAVPQFPCLSRRLFPCLWSSLFSIHAHWR